jgi:hypothetical protein
MMTLLQTGAFAESDDEIRDYTRYTDYTPQAAEPVGLIPGEDHRILVVWFSRVGNTMFDPDVDVVSSATLNRGEGGELVGNAQMIAGWIAEETKADVFQIQTAYTYPSDYNHPVITQYCQSIVEYWGVKNTGIFTTNGEKNKSEEKRQELYEFGKALEGKNAQ